MRPSRKTHLFEPMSECRGFTMIEMVVAMMLLSMLTLILAVAFKMALDSWERGNNGGEALRIKVVLPTLMARQLQALVTQISLSEGEKSVGESSAAEDDRPRTASNIGKTRIALDFVTGKNKLSFFTRYSPHGTPSQGVIRVLYQYDPVEETLEIYEQVIGNRDDIENSDALGRMSQNEHASDDDRLVASIPKVSVFSLLFSDGGEDVSTRGRNDFQLSLDAFEDEWGETSFPPKFVMLRFAQTARDVNNQAYWLFNVGGGGI